MKHNETPLLDSHFYDNTDEDLSRFKIHEAVSVHGSIGRIRDIFVRRYRPKGHPEDAPALRHLSFRMYEKQWQAQELSIFDLEKLEGKLLNGE